MANYSADAHQAATHGLPPATVEDTARRYAELGVTRQAAGYWRRNPDRCPLAARMAVAWFVHRQAIEEREQMERDRPAVIAAVQVIDDPAHMQRVAEAAGVK